jgi:hypothetical protein
VKQVVDPRADIVGKRTEFKTELPLAVGGAEQTELQLKGNAALTTLHKLADLPQLLNANNPVDRRKQIPLTSQSPGETTSELLLVCQYQDWTPKE